MPTASTTAARTTSAAATSSAPASWTATPATAISTTVGTISGRTVSRSNSGNARDCITIEVRFVVREISAAFDGQRGRSCKIAGALFVDTLWSRLSAAHLGPLFFEDGFA